MNRYYRLWLGVIMCSLAFQIVPILYEENNDCVECENGKIIATLERDGHNVVVRSEILGFFESLCK